MLHQGGIPIVRASLTDVAERALCNDLGALFYDAIEVSVVYFRAGYTPDDYPGDAEWFARRVIGTAQLMIKN